MSEHDPIQGPERKTDAEIDAEMARIMGGTALNEDITKAEADGTLDVAERSKYAGVNTHLGLVRPSKEPTEADAGQAADHADSKMEDFSEWEKELSGE